MAASKQMYTHLRNVVLLVWGSLRLASIMKTYTIIIMCNNKLETGDEIYELIYLQTITGLVPILKRQTMTENDFSAMADTV